MYSNKIFLCFQEAKKDPKTIDEHRKECAAGGKECSLPTPHINFCYLLVGFMGEIFLSKDMASQLFATLWT